MHITLRQLQIFRAVAQCARVTAAAETLHISQPAASMALSELEKHLGPLFDRHQGSSLTLNDSGRALLPKACELMDRTAEIEAQFSGDASYRHGFLIVNASSTIGNNLMPYILGNFTDKNPDIRVEMTIENTHQIERRLLDFDIDMGVVEGISLHPDIEATPWSSDELVIVCPPNHPLANQRVNLSDLAQEHWILRESGSGTRALFDEIVAPGIGQPAIKMVLNRSEAIKEAVTEGQGLTCISALSVKRSIKKGNMGRIFVRDLKLQRHFYLLVHKQKYRSCILNRLFNFILQFPVQ
ncbi:HTH-type transcriptional regulator CysL [invertebrate metagenome]|uniref:HTH-type transcriptional regulator CysL n=1 Tax=invertebrate metagenome TaxID=1711999 RepID=A0A2H9TBQ3_9ZZZZ